LIINVAVDDVAMRLKTDKKNNSYALDTLIIKKGCVLKFCFISTNLFQQRVLHFFFAFYMCMSINQYDMVEHDE
jgi:hypothetical protein